MQRWSSRLCKEVPDCYTLGVNREGCNVFTLCKADVNKVCTPDLQTARTGRIPYPNAPSPAPESVDLNGACGYTQQCPDRDTYCKDIKLRGQDDPANCAGQDQSTVPATGRIPYPGAPSAAPEDINLNNLCGAVAAQCPSKDDYCKKIAAGDKPDPQNCPGVAATRPERRPFPGALYDAPTEFTPAQICPNGPNQQCEDKDTYCKALLASQPRRSDTLNCPDDSTTPADAGPSGDRRPFPGATSDVPDRVDLQAVCGPTSQCANKDDYCKKILPTNIPDPANCPVDTQPEQAGYPFPGATHATPGAVRLSDFCPSVQAGANAQCNSQAQYCDALAEANPPVPDPDNCPPGSTNANNAGNSKPLPFPGAKFPAPDNIVPANICPGGPNQQCNNGPEYCGSLAALQPPLSDPQNC